MKVKLHIDRMVLDGLTASQNQGVRLGAAIQTELSRLLRDPLVAGALSKGGAIPKLRAGPIGISANDSPNKIGARIAKSLAAGLVRPR
ncbi:MAG TPA: hypothetical protein VMH86_15200 [Rhizomicrobium sp.]|nr:hypothetical protein [Rhizomicrobium sp.]